MVAKPQIDIGEYQYGFRDEEDYVFKSGRGLTRATVEEISAMKDEPDWMRDFRLRALDHFEKRPMPNWGADLSGIDFDDIFYYIRPAEKQARRGKKSRSTSRTRLKSSESPRRNGSSWPGSARSTRAKSFITRCAKTWKSWA